MADEVEPPGDVEDTAPDAVSSARAHADPPRADDPGHDEGILHAVPTPEDDAGERPVDRAHRRAQEAMASLQQQEEAAKASRAYEHQPRRFQTIALLLIGALAGAFGVLTWSVEPSGRSLEGIVGQIDPTGSAILLSEPEAMAERPLGIVGVLWREGDGEWRRVLSEDGFPTCLGPDDVGAPVRIGLVTDPGGAERPAAESVVWLECLATAEPGPPTPTGDATDTG